MAQPRAGFGWEHLLLAALLLGAGAIHVAMAPPHLGESTLDGAGFLVAGWGQLILAVAVVVRPTRPVLLGVFGASAALIVLWAWSRTAGLPVGAHAGEPESISVVDGVSVVLEVVALALAAALVLSMDHVARVARTKGVAIAGALAAVAFATAAVASPSARGHGDDGHAHDGGEQDAGDGHHDDSHAEHDDAGEEPADGGGRQDDVTTTAPAGDDHQDEVTTTESSGDEHHDDGHSHDDGHTHD